MRLTCCSNDRLVSKRGLRMTGDGESEVLLEFNWKFGMDFDKVVSKHVWIYVRM